MDRSIQPKSGRRTVYVDTLYSVSSELLDGLPAAWEIDNSAYIRSFIDTLPNGDSQQCQQIVFPRELLSKRQEQFPNATLIIGPDGNVLRGDDDLPLFNDGVDTRSDKHKGLRAVFAGVALLTGMVAGGLDSGTINSTKPTHAYNIGYDAPAGSLHRDGATGTIEELCYGSASPKGVKKYSGVGREFKLEGDGDIVVVSGASNTIRVGYSAIRSLVVCGASTNTYVGDVANVGNVTAYGASSKIIIDNGADVDNASANGASAEVIQHNS